MMRRLLFDFLFTRITICVPAFEVRRDGEVDELKIGEEESEGGAYSHASENEDIALSQSIRCTKRSEERSTLIVRASNEEGSLKTLENEVRL